MMKKMQMLFQARPDAQSDVLYVELDTSSLLGSLASPTGSARWAYIAVVV